MIETLQLGHLKPETLVPQLRQIPYIDPYVPLPLHIGHVWSTEEYELELEELLLLELELEEPLLELDEEDEELEEYSLDELLLELEDEELLLDSLEEGDDSPLWLWPSPSLWA